MNIAFTITHERQIKSNHNYKSIQLLKQETLKYGDVHSEEMSSNYVCHKRQEYKTCPKNSMEKCWCKNFRMYMATGIGYTIKVNNALSDFFAFNNLCQIRQEFGKPFRLVFSPGIKQDLRFSQMQQNLMLQTH